MDYIKIRRQLLEKSYYCRDSEKVHLWLHLLLKANWRPREEVLGGKPILCMPGQFTTGRKQLSSETGISESKIERILTYFEKIHLRQKMEILQTPALSLPPTLGIPKEIVRKARDAMRRMAANVRKSKHLPAHGSELAGLMRLLAQSGIPTMETLFRSRF